MSMKMVCNRCNKVKEDGEHFYHIQYICKDGHYGHYGDSEYDLCPECAKLFSIFMNGGTVEEDRYKDSKPSAVVIHKLAGGTYGIEDVPDDQEEHAKFDEWLVGKREEEATNKEEFDDWLQMVTDDPEPQVEPSMDKEESDLSVKTHTNAAGVTVPDSEPWVPVGTGRIHYNRRKDCSNCRYSVEGDESGLNYGPCCGDRTFHTPHKCDLWERRPRTYEQSSET